MGMAAPFGCVTAVYEVAGFLALVGLLSLLSFLGVSFLALSFEVSLAAPLEGVALAGVAAVFFYCTVSKLHQRSSPGIVLNLQLGSWEAS